MNALLTIPQAAERLNVSEKTVRKLVTERKISCVRLGRLIRFEEKDLDGCIQNRKIKSK